MSTAAPQVVATVISVTGVAFARNADGAVRRLAAGDTILEGETVFTLAGGEVELAFADGHNATILASESYMMGPEAMIATSPDTGEAAITAAGEVGKVVTALEQGGDILEGLEAPAAGGAAENSGNDFVRLLRIVEPVTPVGFEYPINTVEEIRAPEGDVIPEEEEENGLPGAGAAEATVDDDGVGGNAATGVGDWADDNLDGDNDETTYSGVLPHDFGSDGPGEVNLAAMDGLTAAVGTETVTFAWNDANDTLTATVTGGDRDGTDLFTVEVNPATGEYTVTLLDNVLHESLDGLAGDDEENDASVVLTYNVVDGNGDVATGSLTINLDDDVPLAGIDDGRGDVTIDETSGVQDDDTTDTDVSDLFSSLTGVATDMEQYAQSASSLVNIGGISIGADEVAEEGSTTALVLEIVGGDGTDSGLETTDGTQIFLYLENGLIVGRIGTEVGDGTDTADANGEIAFAIALGQDGTVSMAQYASITNPTAGDGTGGSHDETADLSGLVNAVATITDDDGDTDTDSVAIGDQIFFSDDGPTADITDGQGSVTIDETAGLQDDDTDDTGVSDLFSSLTGVATDMEQYAQSASSLVDVSGSATGEDEEGATTDVSLEIVGGDGTDSGLETTDGTQIFLYLENGLIVGRIGTEVGDGTDTADADGDIAFAIALAQDGTVSVAQYASVTNPTAPDNYDETADLSGLVNAVVTVTDGDGDTSTDSVDIGDQIFFSDDGPMAVDETTQQIYEGFTTTTDALVGTVDVPASNASSNFVLITTLNGLTGGDTMNVTWTTNGSTNINWELRDGATVVASGTGSGTSLSTTLSDLLATGNYTLWIDATNKALTVTDVSFEHDVSSSLGGNVLSNGDSFGEDEEGGIVSAISYIDSEGNPQTASVSSTGTTVTTQYGTLTINQAGVYTYSTFADVVDEEGATDTFTYTIMDGDGDTDTATMSFDVMDVPDVVPSAAYFTMNTSNTGGGGDTGFQQFQISITDGNVAALSQTVEVANEEGQQDFFISMGGDVVFQNNTQYAITLEHISGSAHLNFTDFSITDKFGNTVTLNGVGGSDNVTLTGDESSSYDGVVYIVTVDGGGNITVSEPVGYDINTVSGDDVLVLGTPTGQLDFSLDMDDLPIGTAANDINLFGEIDRINISGVGTQEDNTLTLSAQDVLDLVDGDNTLWVSGDVGDAVILSDSASWAQGATNVAGPDGSTYTTYTATINATLVTLNVENDVSQPMP